MKISFLLHNVYGIGGTIRSTFNVAGALAENHEVEIVSLMRTSEAPSLALHEAVRIVPLIDLRPNSRTSDVGNPLLKQITPRIPPAEANGTVNFNALTDERMAAYLADTDADAVIATRPGMLIYLAEFGASGDDSQSRQPGSTGRSRGQRGYLRIGQEHRLYETHKPALRAACDAAIARLDAHTTVSEADAATHRSRLPGISTRLLGLPNGVPATGVETSDGRAKLVVAAGRLIPVKRYDLLVTAWATVAAEHPDWKLRLYGRGPQHAALREQIDTLGLADHITLMGAHSPIETEWAKGSIAAVTSREESFGMTIVEAMHCGVPVVATDCPHGPGEIIKNGEDGILVPNGDADAIAKGLLSLIENDDLRRRMGQAARTNAERYAPQHVAAAYENLFRELYAARGQGTALPSRAKSAPKAPRRPLAVMLRDTVKSIVRKPPLRAVATCRADAKGGLVISVDGSGLQGPKLDLTLTDRAKGDHHSIALQPPTTSGGPWTATLAHETLKLAESRWDLHVVRAADGARRRLACRYAEGRGLLTAQPPAGTPFTWWVPYTTVDGFLAVRTWYRDAYAEAHTLHADRTGITVTCALHGTSLPDPAQTYPAPGTAPTVIAKPRTTGEVLTVPVTVLSPTQFRFVISYEQVHAAYATAGAAAGAEPGPAPVWDVSLVPGSGAPKILRVGRILGDVLDRNKTDLYPAIEGVRPYFTKANNLALTRPHPAS
ncbi:glycosyltransferase family 4 protein [Streptomyces zagrosensis]|uniref:D-inositol 3-phosphate glycosyltransferase n=1 Tax=Streptomyces zagrosensis TaxID=1042984 RepID=A0A7W9QGF8_9ACTN|nr:glycosyltransferase family 4 protein [Streptomyces zagrosensis]MBB5939564.1 glycosyltransferase involved in cell wall biosynthesis [Streptomyces zagrosensis]